ncbi:MAG: hypothetical protein ACFE9L_04015 [Candidatus Hodarchaeota archaeon]
MKLTERVFDSTLGLKLKSGTNIEIHVIEHENREQSIIIKNLTEGGQQLILENKDISDFLNLLNDFLNNV